MRNPFRAGNRRGWTAETTVCVPVWDTVQQTRHTVNIVNAILGRPGDFRLVVVDNASPNAATRRFLHKQAKRDRRLVPIYNPYNRGVGPGYNQALALGYRQGSRYFVCLNNDVVIEGDDWLDRLVHPLRENPRQLVGPCLVLHHWDEILHAYMEGWCIACARIFLDDVGYFDEELAPAWAEDVDLAWRAQRHDFKLYETSVPLRHLGGKTGFDGRLPSLEITERNIDRFISKVRNGADGRKGWPQ